MSRVLVSSASYVLTDHLISSEGITCYNILKEMGKYGYFFDAVCGYVQIKKPLSNACFHQTCSVRLSPSNSFAQKYTAHIQFLVRGSLKASKILSEGEVSLVHHMFPAVYDQSFSVLALLGKIGKTPFLFGPVSAHFYPRPIDEKLLMKVTSKMHKKTILKCNHVVTITNRVKKLYSKILGEDKVTVIPLGVDVKVFKPPRKIADKSFLEVLFVGSLYPLKGVRYLIESMLQVVKEVKEVRLRIVGDGPLKEQLKSLAGRLGIKKYVVFEGFIPHTRIVSYYQQSDVFCLPTLGEPFGKVLIEAMACGKPVVASNVGGPSEIVEDGQTGFLVPPADPHAISEKILELLKDEKLRRSMGRKARKTAEKKYSWSEIAKEYHELYSRLLD